jgi:hypothetical protein
LCVSAFKQTSQLCPPITHKRRSIKFILLLFSRKRSLTKISQIVPSPPLTTCLLYSFNCVVFFQPQPFGFLNTTHHHLYIIHLPGYHSPCYPFSSSLNLTSSCEFQPIPLHFCTSYTPLWLPVSHSPCYPFFGSLNLTSSCELPPIHLHSA